MRTAVRVLVIGALALAVLGAAQAAADDVAQHSVGQADAASPIGPIEEQQFTFTEDTGMIPITLENLLDQPIDVVLVLESFKLEFPQGAMRNVRLAPGSTTFEVEVVSRASGSFPLEVRVLSADGSHELSATRFTVRSTAISGLGLVLSVSAGLFLLMWWAKHFHAVRRDRRLVSPNHPAHQGPHSEGSDGPREA